MGQILLLSPHAMSRAPYGARGLKYVIPPGLIGLSLSRPVWGAWIEIKSFDGLSSFLVSRPVWGAWIEMLGEVVTAVMTYGRAPYGARGLKYISQFCYAGQDSRAPYGARGLKLTMVDAFKAVLDVAPRMGRVD